MIGSEGGLLLLSTVAGYWVLERADTHKGELRRIGRVIGGAIIILSLFGLIFRCLAFCQMRGKAGMGWSCPFTSKSAPALKQ